MSSTGVDPEKVISHLSQQIGAMSAELAMRAVALEAAHERIAELEQDDSAGEPEPPTD